MPVSLSHNTCDLRLPVCCHIIELRSAKVLKKEGMQIRQHPSWPIFGKLSGTLGSIHPVSCQTQDQMAYRSMRGCGSKRIKDGMPKEVWSIAGESV